MTMTGHAPAGGGPMLHALARNWWLILLRGICAIIFGALTFVMPGLTLVTLILLYGIYAIADGVLALWAAVAGGGAGSRWWLALVGVLGILAGLAAFIVPGMTAFVLLMFIAGWAIAIGVMEIIGAIRLRNEIDNEWWLILSGILSVLFGLIMIFRPGAGALGLILVIGAYAIVHGVTLVALSFRLRKHA